MLVLGWYSPTVPSGFSNRMVNRVPTLLTSSSENIGRPNISTEADDIFQNSYWTNSKKKTRHAALVGIIERQSFE